MVATTSQYRRYKVIGLYNQLEKMRGYLRVLKLGNEHRTDRLGKLLAKTERQLERLEEMIRLLYAEVYGMVLQPAEESKEDE